MILVKSPCLHCKNDLTIDEAEAQVRELTKRIEEAKQALGPVRAFLFEGVYIDREGFYDFFRQHLPSSAVRNRAGKLYASIVRAAIKDNKANVSAALKVKCCYCGHLLSDNRCKGSRSHAYYYNDVDYLIDTVDLKSHAEHFFPGGIHALRGLKQEDFHLLRARL